MDRYTKIVLTVIALALVALAARPVLQTRVARASEIVDVRIVGVDFPVFPPYGRSLPVRCVEGCK